MTVLASAADGLANRLRANALRRLDSEASTRVGVELAAAAQTQGWRLAFEAAWPTLAAIVAASPYLATLAQREPQRLGELLRADPDAEAARLIAAADTVAGDPEAVGADLRALKARLHLLVALADLGGVWDLTAVTAALSAFADAAVRAALAAAAGEEHARGRLRGALAREDPAPGLFVLALGKHGANELNYSSDIDVSVFYEPAALPLGPGAEAARVALRLTQTLARILSERTPQGYVFRVDLRLRPDPASTPVAVPVEAALAYYESVGQNWERAAMIKARAVAGDRPRAEEFLRAMQPFVWRRALDFAAVADVQSILRQIQVREVEGRSVRAPRVAAGVDLKLSAGGIREIEFFTQTQQLILGGRDLSLRAPATRDALNALAAAGHVAPATAQALIAAYVELRGWEHRVQMLADEQTHRLPVSPDTRAQVAALSGLTPPTFDATVERVLDEVVTLCGALFADEEPLSSPFGPLAFTGVEDDPETRLTLARMGYTDPEAVARTVRAWHHGRIAATRTPRGRELFTRLAPRLLDAAAATGAADIAFGRFASFFERLASGVQIQSLFLAEPGLFALLVRVLTSSPRLADVLARRPAALDALIEPHFFAPIDAGEIEASLADAVTRAQTRRPGLESAMDAVRRVHAEAAFRVGVQVLTGAADAPAAGRAFAALADACLGALAPAALTEIERVAGAFDGEVAVVALGKFGGREMTATSDLDLMTVYRAPLGAASAARGWAAETMFARFTQRLVAALSAPTAEGGLYAVDLQLRPSGTSGPVATSFAAFTRYYAEEAQTWEFLALTRARVAWASSTAFGGAVTAAIEAALRRARDPLVTARDTVEMRALMRRERPPSGFWDMKLNEGGLVDVEFSVQYLQLVGAAAGGPLCPHTGEALAALDRVHAAGGATLGALARAWRMQQSLAQVLRLALERDADPAGEPAALRRILADAAHVDDWERLPTALTEARAAALRATQALFACAADAPRPLADGDRDPARSS